MSIATDITVRQAAADIEAARRTVRTRYSSGQTTWEAGIRALGALDELEATSIGWYRALPHEQRFGVLMGILFATGCHTEVSA